MEREFDNAEPALSREPWTVKVAVWSARHRYPVFAAWFVLIAGLMFGAATMGGQRSQSVMQKGTTIGESQTGWNVYDDANANVKSAVTTESFYLIVSNPKGPLDTPENRAAIAAMTARLAALTTSYEGATVPVFYTDPATKAPPVVDPYLLAQFAPDQAPGVLSADGSTAIITAQIEGDDTAATAKADAIKPLAAQLKAQYPGLTIYAFNNRLINADFGDYINGSLDALLLPTLLVTFLILLVASRSLVSALVPLVLAISAIVGAMGLVGIYSQTIAPVSQYVNQIVVLIGLAVAVDYSLFVISRFRTERGRGTVTAFGMLSGIVSGHWQHVRAQLREQDAQGRGKFGAIEVASSTAGRAVFFSGLAVMISLGGLLLINDDVFKSIAIGSISVVLIAVLGSLTFLPATLSILDRWVVRFGIPGLARDRGEGRGIWGTIVRAATNKPVVAAVAAAAVLLVVALPVTKLQLGSTTSDVSTLPHSVEGVRAWDLISQKWPMGREMTMEVVVTNAQAPATRAAIETFAGAMKQGQVAGVNASTVKVSIAGDGTVADIAASIPGGPNDIANWETALQFRSKVVPAYFGELTGTRAYVTGMAAYTMDYSNWYGGQMPLLIVFVLGMSFLLLLVAFHSIVIPLKAILLNLLSAGAAFGVLVLLFQEGWLREWTGIRPNVVEAWAPAMIFTILFGLSMDYHVFILTRVKEARDRGLASTDAVVKGITITAGTVTSAAAIMVCVFGAFFTIQLAIMQELGVGLAVAILVDATLVRSLLLPSLMKLLGEWNWWMPRFLSWVPRITIEGEPEQRLGGGHPQPGLGADGPAVALAALGLKTRGPGKAGAEGL
jgi:putative drug exporter of the RND superfamily